jgi:hypothetical protein
MFKKKVYEDFVDLSVGKVYFKPIINKILIKVEVLATQRNLLNNALYYLLMEREIVVLSKRRYNNLTMADSNKLRLKTKEILLRDGVVTEEIIKPQEDANLFSKQDAQWFDKQKARVRR